MVLGVSHTHPVGDDSPKIDRAMPLPGVSQAKIARKWAFWGTGVTVTWGSPKPLLEVRFLGPPFCRLCASPKIWSFLRPRSRCEPVAHPGPEDSTQTSRPPASKPVSTCSPQARSARPSANGSWRALGPEWSPSPKTSAPRLATATWPWRAWPTAWPEAWPCPSVDVPPDPPWPRASGASMPSGKPPSVSESVGRPRSSKRRPAWHGQECRPPENRRPRAAGMLRNEMLRNE
jgi:hypothetical protein